MSIQILTDKIRASDHLNHIKPGLIVSDGKRNWIYVGTIKNQIGLELMFVTEMKTSCFSKFYTYKCSFLDTLMKKFPGIHEHVRWGDYDLLKYSGAKVLMDLYCSSYKAERWDD